MKKYMLFLTILAGLFFAAGEMFAQDVFVQKNGSNFEVSLDAGDTVSSTGVISKVVGVGAKGAVQLYSVQVSMDSISGTPTVATTLQGSMDGTNYTTISTVNWAGTSSDTTFYFTDISTGVAWSYLRVRATASAGKGQATKLIGRVLDKVK